VGESLPQSTDEDTVVISETGTQISTNNTMNQIQETSPKINTPNAKKNTPTTKTNANINTVAPTGSVSRDEESGADDKNTNFDAPEKILLDKSWSGSGNKNNYSHYWGKENVTFSGDSFKIFYPKNSNAPSNSPRG